MKLQVRIVCAACGRKAEVHVLGGWDIKNVLHECEGDLGHGGFEGRELRTGEFALAFDPPRRAF